LAICITFIILEWIAVGLRVYVRGFMTRSFGWDDGLMLLTLFLATTLSAVTIEVANGNPASTSLATTTGCVVASIALYIATMTVLKLSLAAFYLQIFIVKWQRWVIIAAVGICTLFSIASFFVAIFQCGKPKDYLINEAQLKCLPFDTVIGPLNYTYTALNAATDWVFAILPFFILRNSNMPFRTKVSVYFLLALGAVGSVASCVRFGYIGDLAPGGNILKATSNIAIWQTVEPGCGIAAGSIATLRPLLKSLVEKTQTVFSSRSYHSIRMEQTSETKPKESPIYSDKGELSPGLTVNSASGKDLESQVNTVER